MKISVVYSPSPRVIREWEFELQEGQSVRQAIGLCGVLDAFPELATTRPMLGIWGRQCSLDQLLRDRDRIEIYRPLRVDPKMARRERFNRQGVKRAGLFSKVREGAKAGY